jgi:ArsR family transcriptional regulator, arsenate/arsenite/antimonite-responsive transcriptional repressor
MTALLGILKSLADKTRLEMVVELEKKGSMTCAEVSSKFSALTQPTLSHHFKILTKAGVITVTKEGTSCRYSLNTKTLKQAGIVPQLFVL